MTTSVLKTKIKQHIDKLDDSQLKAAYLIVKEIANQSKYQNIETDKNEVNKKIAKGIQQLDNNEGTDFRQFLQEMKTKYGQEK